MGAVVTLTAYNMGDVTEQDFDDWAHYVSEKIGEYVDFSVEVNQFQFRRGPSKDAISGCSDEQREELEEALQDLWADACGDDFDPKRSV